MSANVFWKYYYIFDRMIFLWSRKKINRKKFKILELNKNIENFEWFYYCHHMNELKMFQILLLFWWHFSLIVWFFFQKIFCLFQVKLIYPNGAKVDVNLVGQLDSISGDAGFDRLFINTHFAIMFSEKYIRKQVKKGLDRKNILDKFRSSNRYEIMQFLYDYRVLSDGRGDIKYRLKMFKLVFRTKFNNWFCTHGANVSVWKSYLKSLSTKGEKYFFAIFTTYLLSFIFNILTLFESIVFLSYLVLFSMRDFSLAFFAFIF